MTTQELIEKRNSLVKKRDEIQTEIVSLYHQIKEETKNTVINMGLYRSKWKHLDNIYNYSTEPDEFFMEDDENSKAIRKYLKLVNLTDLALSPIATLTTTYSYDSLRIFFQRPTPKSEIRKFIEESGLKVDFNSLDQSIEKLANKKKELVGS